MSEITTNFADGFVGAFKLAGAIIVGIGAGAYRLFSRLGRQYDQHEPLR